MPVKKTSNRLIDFDIAKYTNCELVNGKIQLKIVNTINGVNYYFNNASVEFEIVDLDRYIISIQQIIDNIQLPPRCSFKVYTSTSNDNFDFTEYSLLNDDKTISSPQGRYIRVKLELNGNETLNTKIIDSFSSDQSLKFKTNEYVDFNNGLKVKSLLNYKLIESSSFTEGGKLFVKQFDLNEFKAINSMEVK